MPKLFACPFWRWEEKLKQHCEAGRVDYPSREARAEYQGMYCANVNGWNKCTLAMAMCREYERKDEKNV